MKRDKCWSAWALRVACAHFLTNAIFSYGLSGEMKVREAREAQTDN